MATRNIYVREGDKELWERAERLAGDRDSLSSLLSDALREYVESREREEAARQALQERMEEYEFQITAVDPQTNFVLPGREYKIRFIGALLSEVGNTEVYLTKGGKLIMTELCPGTGLFYREYDDVDELIADNEDELDENTIAEITEGLGKEYVRIIP